MPSVELFGNVDLQFLKTSNFSRTILKKKGKEKKKSYCSHNLVNHDKGILLLINLVDINFFFFKRIKTTKFEGSTKFIYIYKIKMKKSCFSIA